MNNTQTYFRFLNLARAIRQLPTFPALDTVEESLLNALGAAWYDNKRITVLQAMKMLPEISDQTTYRRIKSLRHKSLIQLQADKLDSRIKYVVPTPLATKYFSKLGHCLSKAIAAE